MKATKHIFALFRLLFCLAVCIAFVHPAKTYAQAMPSWWGSDRIWDWSDFRMNVGLRFSMPTLKSGTVRFIENYDMLGSGNFSFQPQPDYFKEWWFILYIGRLALRAHFEEDHHFRGFVGVAHDIPLVAIWPWGVNEPLQTLNNPLRFSDLDIGWTRFGLDLDIIRYPFLRAGINVDRNFASVIYLDRQNLRTLTLRPGRSAIVYDPDTGKALYPWIVAREYSDVPHKLTTAQPPVTVGVHAFASPGRIRGIPVVAQARARFPFPFLAQITSDKGEAKVTDWEVYVGLRPNIWSTSLYSMNTFALGIEAGFRSSYLDMSDGDGVWQVKAHWQGPFVQVGLYY